MKKHLYLLIIAISFILGGFFLYFTTFSKNKIIYNEETEDREVSGINGLAIMLQDDDCNYHLSNEDTWPTEGYVFNATLSKCENGGTLSWNEGKVTLKTSGSDKCYVYFDKFSLPTVAKFITELAQGQETITGDGYLYHHDETLENGAKDNGYRYAGNNPNNFICFGLGSEEYNNSGTGECPLTNQYRIIGLVPVEKKDGTQDTLVKVIKSEYITVSDLGKTAKDFTPSVGSYTSLKRVQGDVTTLDGFYWNYSESWSSSNGAILNYWAKDGKTADLNKNLNEYYLKTTLGSNWSSKIEDVQWNIGGTNNLYTPRQMKIAEESIEIEGLGGTIISTGQIGLMYAYDYGFAASKNSWMTNLGSYSTDINRQYNWLFNGVNEYLITRSSTASMTRASNPDGTYIHIINNTGYVSRIIVKFPSDVSGARPVFYLTPDVKIISDVNANGSYEHPYRIVL